MDEFDVASSPHGELSCAQVDALSVAAADELAQLARQSSALITLVDSLKEYQRELVAANEALSKQNDLLQEELLASSPSGAILSLHLTQSDLARAWRAASPGSRGPVPGSALKLAQEVLNEVMGELPDRLEEAFRGTVQLKAS